MTDQSNQEPTMEEILASIRRIISEDDPPAEGAEAAPAATPDAEPAPAPQPVAFAQPAEVQADDDEDEVLELTERVDAGAPAPQMESVGDLDVFPAAVPAPAPVAAAPAPRAPAPAFEPDENLVSPPAATEAATAFASLSGAIGMPRDGRVLEDVVRELLRPLMKQWLDDNLPRIVEAAVQTEVERIARRHG